MIPSAFGAFLFVLLLLARISSMISAGSVESLDLLLAFQAGLAAFLLVFRHQKKTNTSLLTRMIAWGSAFLPLALRVEGTSVFQSLLPIPGLILNLYGLAVLGRSFSISPADRGLVRKGPYRIIRHPVYAGELLSLVGSIFSAFSLWNLGVVLVFLASVMRRIRKEEAILSGYEAYKNTVRWQLLPGVW